MKRKLGFLMTLVIALCTSSAWAQSVVSVGTNLDFSEGTPVDNGICTYDYDTEKNGTTYSQMLPVTGWEFGVENGNARSAGLFAYGSGYWLGSKENIAPATNPEGAAEGNALGVVAVWDAVAQYVQPVTLEAGNYVINIPVYNSVGGTTAPAKSLIGFIADNGTEYLAPAKAYAVNAWTVETITFTLTETTTGKLSLGYDAPNSGSGANQHLFFDKVEIMAVTETDLARADLDAVIATAQATVDAKAGVGAGLFMYSEEAYNTYAAAVAAAKAVSENAEATKDDLVAALAALNAATEAYAVTAPAADAVYALKFNGTENYLTIGESNITIEATADELSFEAVGNGKYYIHDKEGKYLSYAGNNKWTMSASADVKDEWTVSVNAEGLYTLTGKNGGLGVDGTEAGSSCYGDKNGAAVALWAIAEIVIEEEPVVDPNDYTSYIVNADLSTTDAWNAEGTKGISGGMVKVGSQAVYDFSQTITLPAGQYKMTAKAVYRYGSDEQAEYDAIVAGTETHKTKLYAETATYKYEADVQNRYDGASDTDYAGSGTVTINGKYVPNSSSAVQAWFNAGQYVNELVFNVQEDGQIKIGITTVDGIAGDYGNIGAWTLTRLGDAEADPKEEEPTPEVPELIVWTINQADYPAGEQYAKDEPHVINDALTIYTTDCHWRTDQLRVYSSATNNGFFYSNKLPAAIKSIEFTAGNKVDVLVVYGSNDGATWTEVAKVNVPATSYTSGLVADFTGTAYNYFKVDVEGTNQVRITNMVITLDPSVKLPIIVSAPSFSLSGCNLFAPATVELTAAEGTIYWSTDNENFVAYAEPIAIDATCTIYAYAEVEGSKSVVASAEYVMATTYDNVAALLAAEATSAGVPVIVKLEATVDSLGLNKSGEVTSAFLVEGTDTLMIYDYNIPADYVVGNVVKGQLAGLWKDYKGTLELCNVDYSGATASTPTTPEAEEFMAAAMALASLTETMPSIWTIPAVSEKFMAVQEKAFGMVDTLNLVPVDTLVYYTALMNETAAFAQAMDAEFNEWKALLFTCYDYQDNSTADEAARAAFDELVNTHMGYQYSMPATTVAELEALTAELDDARIAYALVATANDGFDFGLPTVDSPWVGAAVADGMSAYLYNASAKAFLGAGNSWGTQASFNDGIEWVVAGAEKLYTFSGTVSNGGEQHYFTGTYTDGAATQVTVKPVGKGIYTLQVGGAYVAYDGTNIVANVAEVSEACYWQFVTKEERQSKYATASVLNPASATFEISGANFSRNDGANSAWTGSPKIAGENDNMNGEKWNAGIVEVSQILRGMPNGVYRLSAQGFYRMGGVAAAAEARANGTEELHGKFFANGDTIPVMSVMEEAGKVDGVGADYGTFGKAPNSQGEASKFFNAGLYEHSFMFTLAEGVDTIKLGATKTGSVGDDWLLFDNFRLEYLGAKNDVDYLGNGTLTSVPEGNHYVFYTDAEGGHHFLYAAGDNNWVVLDKPVTIAFSAGNITDGYAGAASFMNSNNYYMSNAANSDGSGAIKTEAVGGSNGLKKRTWESQVFYKNAAGKYAIRLTNATGTGWGANCFVNIDPATLAVASGQPSLGDALYLWEIADEDDPRFSTQVLLALIEQAEALTDVYNKDVKAALAAVVEKAKVATAAEVQAIKAELEAAIAAAKASIADYKTIAEQLAIAKAVLAETAIGYAEFVPVVTEVETAYAEATATADALPVLKAAIAAYLAANEVDTIVNGTFADGTTGWTGAMNTGNHNKWTNVNDQFVEKWTASGALADLDFYQEISGLPAGTYTFAAYVVACRQSELDSHEVTGVTLYANAEATAVHTINVDRNPANQAIGAELVMVTATIAEGETLKVGLKVASTDANWVVMDNAKLYCFDMPANPCLKTYEVNLVDVKVTDWAVETVIDAAVMAEITELLGAKASELTYQLVDTTGVHSNYNGNAGEVLFWVDLEGNLSNWGVNNKFFISYDSIAPAITTTQYGVSEGDVLNATVRLANAEGQYVEIKITESIYVSPIINIADFEVVSTIKVAHNETAGVTYSANTALFDPISTASALGVASLADAEQYILNVTTGNLVANTTDGWRDAYGDAAGWGNEGGVCVKINDPASGMIDYIGCYDATHEAGEVYTAKWAFVHEGKAVVIEVVITFIPAQGIDNIETTDDAVIYTITGKRVQGDVKSLERGIYIVNGRKVLVK